MWSGVLACVLPMPPSTPDDAYRCSGADYVPPLPPSLASLPTPTLFGRQQRSRVRGRFIADATQAATWTTWRQCIEGWWAATLTHERLNEIRVVGDIEQLAGAQSVGQGVVQLAEMIEHLHPERLITGQWS